MGRSKETFGKKEVRKKQEKKRKEKEARKLARKAAEKNSDSQDDMIAYVDEFGRIVSEPPEVSAKSEVKLEDIEISVAKKSDEDSDDFTKTGVVSFFNEQKGYGFIRESESKQSVFVHIKDVQGTIKEGNRVTFKMGSGPRGAIAIEVQQAD